jgi:hypothetical protein
MFFYWATGKINAQDTPFFMFIQRQLLYFFQLFAVQKTQKEMQKFFWHDETTEMAKAHIKQYKDGIRSLQQKYADEENLTYEQHMQERRALNRKLAASASPKKGEQDAEPKNSEGSTNAGSSKKDDDVVPRICARCT